MISKLNAPLIFKHGFKNKRSYQFRGNERNFRRNSSTAANVSKNGRKFQWAIPFFGFAIAIPIGILIRKLNNGTNVVIASTQNEEIFSLNPLPYERSALSPWISAETVSTHYDKHHKGYVDKLNSLLENNINVGTLEGLIMRENKGQIFNMAAQVWNHDFYWLSMSPSGGGKPDGEIHDMIMKSFGSIDEFKRQFCEASMAHFGSGWTWLVYDPSLNHLSIITTHDAKTPITKGYLPILVCDIWEHAYYLDYKNDKRQYVEKWWNVVNWSFANENLKKLKSP